uniref:Fluoride-specific ion channel FluC n=1 Tax=Prevotella sp. GTC17259 TaxID=3236795 RepID=A0AB33JDZ1_9BACT
MALGGAIGTVLRFLLSRSIQGSILSVFPYGTWVVNVLGCLLIGIFYGLSARVVWAGGDMKLFLTVGLCGGLTTFSTFCNENLMLLRDGHPLTAALYAGVSLATGLLAVYVGHALMRQF